MNLSDNNKTLMDRLQEEIIYYELTKYLSETSLLSLKCINKRFYSIITKYIDKYVKTISVGKLFKQYLVNLLKNKQYITLDYVLKSNPKHRDTIQFVCQYDRQKTLNYILKCGNKYFDWGLYGACKGGHQHLAELMIKHGANDFNWGLRSACDSGHQHLVELMIKHGATHCGSCNNSNHKFSYFCQKNEYYGVNITTNTWTYSRRILSSTN